MTVNVADDVPAVGFIARGDVFTKPRCDFTVNGDAVAVVEADEFAETKSAGQRAGFGGYAFHQAAVAEEDVGVVVYERQVVAVVARSQMTLGDGHPDGGGDTLTKRAGGDFDSGGVAVFRVAGGFAV